MALRFTADGCQETADLATVDCCPPPLCGDELCGTFCAFIGILPSGPMWDYWKRRATSFFQSNPENPLVCEPLMDPACPSIVQHAIYTVLKLRDLIHNALYPALRESDPTTAEVTLDDWLERFHWEDCYRQHCRSVILGAITAYEVHGPCGPIYCEVPIPEALNNAVKRGVVIALTRANMGVIKNLCGINWIIEPLGAEVLAVPVAECPDPFADEPCDSECCTLHFNIQNKGATIQGVLETPVCEAGLVRPNIQAYLDTPCDMPAGLPEVIWPGVIAAECIVRSLLPLTCGGNITIRNTCVQSLLLLSGDQNSGNYHLLSGDQSPGRQVIT